MKRRIAKIGGIIWKPLLAIIGLGLLIVWTTGVFSKRVGPGSVAYEAGFPLPPDAQTLTVTEELMPSRVPVIGTVTSEVTVQLTARVNAHIDAVHVAAGDAVEKGDLLFTLDHRQWSAQRAATEARRKQARTEYERTRNLYERQAATEQQRIAAEAAFHEIQAQLDEIDVALSYTEIRSPLTGVVSDRFAEAGMVAQPGQHLATVYDTSRMRLDAAVPVRLIDYLTIGDTVAVKLERPRTNVSGRIHRIVGEIDPRSRTQMVQVMLEAAESRPIFPGTFGRFFLEAAAQRMVRLPATAIRHEGQLAMVQVIENERAFWRLVRTGVSADGRTEILSGVTDGDVVLLNPKEGT